MVTLQIFTKQSHGIINLILVFFSIFIISILKKQNIYFITKITIAFFVFQLVNIFLLSNLMGIDIPISLSQNSDSLNLKGLAIERPLEIFLTIIPYSLKSVFFIFGAFFVKFLLQKSNLKRLLPITLLIFPLWAYYFSKFWFLLYYILIGILFYQLFVFIKNNFIRKNFENHKLIGSILFISSFPLLGSVMAEQMSWPGYYYIKPPLIIFILLISVIIFFVNDYDNLFFYKKFFISYPIFIFIMSIYFVETKPSGYDHKSLGLVKIENLESFKGWKTSQKTLGAIQKLERASTSCKGNTLFQLSWMPISFEITSRINTTGYDLPYHDTITLEEAKSILKDLVSEPPGMLIVQPKYFAYAGPFPAAGMKYLYNNLDGLLKYYQFNSVIEDNFNKFKVYCLD